MARTDIILSDFTNQTGKTVDLSIDIETDADRQQTSIKCFRFKHDPTHRSKSNLIDVFYVNIESKRSMMLIVRQMSLLIDVIFSIDVIQFVTEHREYHSFVNRKVFID